MRRLAGAVRRWWSDKWIWAAACILGSAIFVVAGGAWKLAARPVNGTEGLPRPLGRLLFEVLEVRLQLGSVGPPHAPPPDLDRRELV